MCMKKWLMTTHANEVNWYLNFEVLKNYLLRDLLLHVVLPGIGMTTTRGHLNGH